MCTILDGKKVHVINPMIELSRIFFMDLLGDWDPILKNTALEENEHLVYSNIS